MINSCLSVFCDGGARGNPGPAAIGFLIKTLKGKVLVKKHKCIGKSTNNVAEYQAVIEALSWIDQNFSNLFQDKDQQLPEIHFYLDSLLVINQLNGRFKIKNSNLKQLVLQARGIENQIKGRIYYHYIPREKNWQADKLVNQALDEANKNI